MSSAPRSPDAVNLRSVEVSGSGHATVSPDLATIRAGVASTGTSLDPTRIAASDKLRRGLDAALASGIDRGDIQTDQLNVRFDSNDNRHHVSSMLTIVVRDLTTIDGVVDQLFSAIGDGMALNGIEFGASDASAAASQARAAAFANAEQKASHLAHLAGQTLGPVLRIAEGHSGGGNPRPMMARAAQAGPMPIEEGTLEERVTVTILWELR